MLRTSGSWFVRCGRVAAGSSQEEDRVPARRGRSGKLAIPQNPCNGPGEAPCAVLGCPAGTRRDAGARCWELDHAREVPK